MNGLHSDRVHFNSRYFPTDVRCLLSNLCIWEELEKGLGKSETAVKEDGPVRLEIFAVEPSEKEGRHGVGGAQVGWEGGRQEMCEAGWKWGAGGQGFY